MTIYTLTGAPMDREWWTNTVLGIAERKNVKRPVSLAVDPAGNYVVRAVRDKLGDIMRVYRGLPLSGRWWHGKYSGEQLREIRRAHGVGRPLAVTTAPTFASAVKLWGSQRAAAKALGLNLSTLQRRLKKEAA